MKREYAGKQSRRALSQPRRTNRVFALAGDLCDGTEIDEILSLRILTSTDEEKREMRESDERGRRILERTESLPEEQWLKLHGVLRGP
jgi:hypothetical protein